MGLVRQHYRRSPGFAQSSGGGFDFMEHLASLLQARDLREQIAAESDPGAAHRLRRELVQVLLQHRRPVEVAAAVDGYAADRSAADVDELIAYLTASTAEAVA